ncbi:S-layer homology domain-containing protein [Moorella naiadis]|uniref:S-layer homology domain-containing protein n=1 Tax=Moorella naiadis (nom. illeg.) TaxID=3093670 RepID=UPI003D9C8649
MRKASLTGLILFLMFLPWGTAWADPSASELLSLLPPARARAAELTRGGFAVMLAAAAGIKGADEAGDLPGDVPPGSWYAPALQALWQQGLIQGYPGGTLRPEQPITGLEAVILTARALGLPNEISSRGRPAGEEDVPYGLSQYTFFRHQGLLPPGEPGGILEPDAAAGWLAAVFGSENRAEGLLARCRQALARQQAIRVQGKIGLQFHSRPGLPATAELDRLVIQGDSLYEIILPGKMHQLVTLHLEKQQELTVEQFVTAGRRYRRVVGSGSATGAWQSLTPAPEVAVLLRQQQNLGLPAGIYPYLHYHYLGRREIEGREVVGVSFYARQNKPAVPGDLLPPQLFGRNLEGYFDQPDKLIRSISYWGIVYLDAGNFLPVASDLNLVLSFAPERGGQLSTMAAMEARFQATSYTFAGFNIELPASAMAAPVQEN